MKAKWLSYAGNTSQAWLTETRRKWGFISDPWLSEYALLIPYSLSWDKGACIPVLAFGSGALSLPSFLQQSPAFAFPSILDAQALADHSLLPGQAQAAAVGAV